MKSEELSKQIQVLLLDNSISLVSGGSREPGLPREIALSLLDLLIQLGKPVFGIEVWRNGPGGLRIDSLDGWYSESSDPATSALEAKNFLLDAQLGYQDVVTIQW